MPKQFIEYMVLPLPCRNDLLIPLLLFSANWIAWVAILVRGWFQAYPTRWLRAYLTQWRHVGQGLG